MSDQEAFLGLPILDGHRITGERLEERHERIARHLHAKHGVRVPHHRLTSAAPALRARVYRGTWIVDCPTCRSAEMAWRAEPRFFCSECLNQANGGLTYAVRFPSQADRIEAILRRRHDPATRNWTPGESLAALRRENTAHGLDAP